MAYTAKPLSADRFAKAKELQAEIQKTGFVPQRTFFYFSDLIAEVERLRAELRKAREQAIEDSWARNPDTSGGAFTDREILDSLRGGW